TPCLDASSKWLLALLGALSAFGCGDGSKDVPPAPALLHTTMAGTAFGVASEKWSHLPVPPEDGPELAPVSLITPVLAAPVSGAEVIGYLRLGEKVARSEEPVSQAGCPGGW